MNKSENQSFKGRFEGRQENLKNIEKIEFQDSKL